MEKKKVSIKKIIGTAISAICIILCFYIALEVIISSNTGRPPRIFGVSVSYVPTESMEPNIHAGDYVVFTKTDFDSVNIGDVVVYKNDQNMFIIHRVVEKYETYLITKGDNNSVADSIHITKDNLYGKYQYTLGFMKIFNGGINKGLVFGILVGILALAVIMQVVQLAIKSKTDEVKQKTVQDRKALLEQMKKEILEEELAKIKEEQAKLKEPDTKEHTE